jgi:DNA-binding transcriptional MerR regulator
MPAKLTEVVQTAETAEILGVAQNTLRKLAERGDIPMRRNPANGQRLFRRADLETSTELLNNRQRASSRSGYGKA